MAKDTITMGFSFSCPYCQHVRQVSVHSRRPSVTLPQDCPVSQICKTEALRSYYVQENNKPAGK
jgi:hypothetical protein